MRGTLGRLEECSISGLYENLAAHFAISTAAMLHLCTVFHWCHAPRLHRQVFFFTVALLTLSTFTVFHCTGIFSSDIFQLDPRILYKCTVCNDKYYPLKLPNKIGSLHCLLYLHYLQFLLYLHYLHCLLYWHYLYCLLYLQYLYCLLYLHYFYCLLYLHFLLYLHYLHSLFALFALFALFPSPLH